MSEFNDIAGLHLQDHLGVTWANHQAIAHNLANANTPGFQGTRVTYKKGVEMPLVLELRRTSNQHLNESAPLSTPHAQIQNSGPVQLDSELAEMSKNTLFFQSLLEAVQRRDKMARVVLDRP